VTDPLLPATSWLQPPEQPTDANAASPAAPSAPSASAKRPTPPTEAIPTPEAKPPIAVLVERLYLSYAVFGDRNDSLFVALRKGFRSREAKEVAALVDVSFTLYRGDSLGLIGHNGAGKSTLLQSIAGFIRPSAGRVMVSSQPQLLSVKAALNGNLSGRRNIELGCLALGISRDVVVDLIPTIAGYTELGDFIELPVKTYSSGMRQRLSFAIATAQTPEILLIDEALAVGDKAFKAKSVERLNKIRSDAGVVILASHSMPEIKRACNKALWLHNGEVAGYGDPRDVVKAYRASTATVKREVQSVRQKP